MAGILAGILEDMVGMVEDTQVVTEEVTNMH